MKRFVCDTGPVLHLLEIDALDILGRLGEVFIPPAVEREMASHVASWDKRRPKWLHVKALDTRAADESVALQASGILHAGESESLELAKSLKSDWYLTDDAAARVLATSLGIEVHGTLGIVLWAAATEKLSSPEAEAMLESLAKSSLWLSSRVLAEAKLALEEIYSVQ